MAYPAKSFLSFTYPSRKSTFLSASLCTSSVYFYILDSTFCLAISLLPLRADTLGDAFATNTVPGLRTQLQLVAKLNHKFYIVGEHK